MKTARPVYANAGVEAWYRKKLQTLVRDMSKSVLLHVQAAWKRSPPPTGFAQDADSTDALRRAMEKWGGLWTQRLNDLSIDIATQFATRSKGATETAMKASFDAAGFTVKFKPSAAVRTAYKAVIAENTGLIKSIPAKYMQDVQTSVWQSVMRGGDLATLSQTIQEKYGIAYRRAALIARDQNNKAKATIENERRKQLGIKEAIWMHSSAGKEPRPTHVKMGKDKLRYTLTEGAYDSAVKKRIWPGELINCRCTSRSVIPGFED